MTPAQRMAATAALLVMSCGMFVQQASADPAPALPTPVPQPTPVHGPAPGPAPSPAPAPARTIIDHDGVYDVGVDIVPGVYTSAGPAGDGVCYWKRLGDDAKQPLDNAMSKKPQIVKIDATDKKFKTNGCQVWQKNDTAVPDPGKSPEQVGLPLGILNALIGGGRTSSPSPTPTPAPVPPK